MTDTPLILVNTALISNFALQMLLAVDTLLAVAFPGSNAMIKP